MKHILYAFRNDPFFFILASLTLLGMIGMIVFLIIADINICHSL